MSLNVTKRCITNGINNSMEQEPVLNAHNKDEYPPMHTGGSNTPLKKPSVINCCFVWLLKYWWVPVCLTTLCYSFDLAGDFYSYANHTDYLIDWFPYTHVLLLLGLLSFLWRGISFFVALVEKKWKIALFLFLFHLLSWVLFYFVNLRYYPYSEL